jgi:hypothetical protein
MSDDLTPISNQDQRVDTKKYDSNFDRIFGEKKKGVSGKYVYRDGKWVSAGKADK